MPFGIKLEDFPGYDVCTACYPEQTPVTKEDAYCPQCAVDGVFKRWEQEYTSDDQQAFEDWLTEQIGGDPDRYISLTLALVNEPHLLLHRWRFDHGPLAERVTVAVRKCGCGQHLGVDLWKGLDAGPELYVVTTGMCDSCLAEIERECDERERMEVA